MSQELAIQKIKEGANVFVTGPGGVGKSWVIKQIIDKSTLLCAPTGIAALNIGGSTCHKVFGLPIGLPTQADYKGIPPKVAKVLGSKHLKRIIIDEVGMVRADYFDLINHRLQQARKNDLPFGGIQMVVVGDFYQLSPIVTDREKGLFFQKYWTAFAFGAASWHFETVKLDKVYRQEDTTHVAVLNSFRKKDKHHLRAFSWMEENSLPYDEGGEDLLHLCAYKADAARVNAIHYAALDTKEMEYRGITNNKYWSNDVPVEQIVKLRIGAKVVICANDPEGQYTNGQRGIVKSLSSTSVTVEVEEGHLVNVYPFSWETYTYNNTAKGLSKSVEYMYNQIPLLLGYAITTHKSQGMSLDGLSVDVGKGCFAHGQLYVALSRAKDLTKLSLASPIGERDLIVDTAVKEFYGDC